MGRTVFVGRLAVALATLACGGCYAVLKNVPPTFARVAEPIDEVAARPGVATVVLVYRSGPAGGSQAVTVVLEDEHPVGQATPRGFAVARIPPGRHSLVGSVPELGVIEFCRSASHDFRPGKIYVVDVSGLGPITYTEPSGLVPPKGDYERVLSRLSHLELDMEKGKSEVAARRAFWKECIAHATSEEEKVADARRMKLPPGPELAVDKLVIPPPP